MLEEVVTDLEATAGHQPTGRRRGIVKESMYRWLADARPVDDLAKTKQSWRLQHLLSIEMG